MSKRIIKLIAERIEFIQEVVSDYNTELSELQIELGQLLGEPDDSDITFAEADKSDIGKEIVAVIEAYKRARGTASTLRNSGEKA